MTQWELDLHGFETDQQVCFYTNPRAPAKPARMIGTIYSFYSANGKGYARIKTDKGDRYLVALDKLTYAEE